MLNITNNVFFITILGIFGLVAFWKAQKRLRLSLAKHPSLTGHLRFQKAFTGFVPRFSYSKDNWLSQDSAPEHVISRRQKGFNSLSNSLKEMAPKTINMSKDLSRSLPDLDFISKYKVPFQFSSVLDDLPLGAVWKSTDGNKLVDYDGNEFIDISGSYGVNLLGADFYKQSVDKGVANARDFGTHLGGYHSVIFENIEKLKNITKKENISFHMSGTEAVMQAVRLARFKTGKKKIVRFSGAYHGWWDDVQPGPGNPMPPSNYTLTLREMHINTLNLLRRRTDIACVLVNPIQVMHPNKSAPGDSTLIDSSRSFALNVEEYKNWLTSLRRVCSEQNIILIFDEVFVGFRLALGGAQEYFGVCADLVTYGKTLGGGLPIGVLAGDERFMKRYKEKKPGEITFARGTFNAHPYVLSSMNIFLKKISVMAKNGLYEKQNETWKNRLIEINLVLKDNELPIRFCGIQTVWGTIFTKPSMFNWLLQFYLRKHLINIGWIGTGRFIFNFSFSKQDFITFKNRFVNAALNMKQDGWWDSRAQLTNGQLKKHFLLGLLQAKIKGDRANV
ncbi:MAG: Glutamate-1-semialdehyde 2,1-aminomutase [Bacteroidetes bacterium MED-G17]|nr:MAG: Glutamate-1-semialdehyde 2,1-aminomutase [Bacteroidetes bacterium MED-G17]